MYIVFVSSPAFFLTDLPLPSSLVPTQQQLVKQVQKNSGIIEQVVFAIAGAQIIKEPLEGSEIVDLTEFYDTIERERQVCGGVGGLWSRGAGRAKGGK